MKTVARLIPIVALLGIGSEAIAASDRMVDGEKSYRKLCACCHENGTMDAPVTGNPEDWKTRSPLWDGVLLEHAEKGYLKMPAKGGADYATDYDVGVAAEYMLTITHPNLPED